MIKVILTDIEGTISSISFVKDVLFPFARKNLAVFVKDQAANPEVAEIISQVKKECGHEMTLDEVVETLAKWSDEDKKITPLKTLQGLIWEDGFKKNVFKAHIYADALEKMRAWKNQGLPIYVYSSGSVFAQKLFFTYNEAGNILPLFSGHYDTTVGGKKEAASYVRIAADLKTDPAEILFLSDIVEELDAAAEVGMRTILICRDGKIPQTRQRVETDFKSIDLQGNGHFDLPG